MTLEQIQVMILYLFKFYTDESYMIHTNTDELYTLSGQYTYINDGLSTDPSGYINAVELSIFRNKYHTVQFFNTILEKLGDQYGICVYAYYEDFNEYGKCAIIAKTGTSTISSLYYNNHCLAYIDILLKLGNVYIDLSKFDI